MKQNKNFALIGAGGYVAPKHMQAIKDTNNKLTTTLDISDSVGILDSFSHDIDFFTEFERFDRHIEKLKRLGNQKQIHYVSICSPNYLHDAHIRFALRVGADAICEKPLVLNPWNIDALAEIEKETNKKIYNILQLRVHPDILKLKENLKRKSKKSEIILTYITSRGKWYHRSWKGQIEKSGGIVSNIGIHFFDMLIWMFGNVEHSEVHLTSPTKTAGFIELENANVRWFLSTDKNDLPNDINKPTYRSIIINGNEVEFSNKFTNLHTTVYQNILNGNGFGLKDVRPSIDLVYKIRKSKIVKKIYNYHPYLIC